MDIQVLTQIIEPILGHPIDKEQSYVINHGSGPLWVVAGPGSGKTEVLVVRVLKLIFVDAVNPKSIIVTTFTEKAANNLFERILKYAGHVFQKKHGLEQQIDIHSLRIGTLHSLCNDIMSEYRYPEYENYRLLDEMEQYLFIYEHSDLAKDSSDSYISLWEKFDYLVQGYDPVTDSRGWKNRNKPPNRWKRTNAAINLFNRITEDIINLDKLKISGDVWENVFHVYNDYLQKLENNKRCDFANLQYKFLKFLNSEFGILFLEGDGSESHPGIQYVMVDEYQDTNPIQEAIYFKLTESTKNLCVVGDDDQALYRFRGGTVDCMVTFDQACNRYYGMGFNKIEPSWLNANYRSHSKIVHYYDAYISSFPVMNLSGARVGGKPTLDPRSEIAGNYPTIAYIKGNTIELTASSFAEFVVYLLDNNNIQCPNQCALLMRSVREKQRSAGPFAEALRNVGIQPYNPRSKTFLQQEEIKAVLGAFVSIIDPDESALGQIKGKGIQQMVGEWVEYYRYIESNFPELSAYISKSKKRISHLSVNTWLDINILEIFYRILAHEPFATWENDPERTYRLGKLSKLFETYASVPYPDLPGSNRGKLKISANSKGKISCNWRLNFYYSFIGLLVSKGIDDPEMEIIISPPDRLPIMTVHQAKGLEFPFVFVYGLKQYPKLDSSVLLEDDLSFLRYNQSFTCLSPNERSEQDLIRFYYVAYSRAQYALIHLVPKSHFGRRYTDPYRRQHGFGFISQDINTFKISTTNLQG